MSRLMAWGAWRGAVVVSFAVVASFITSLVMPSSVSGQTLRWELKADESLKYQIKEEVIQTTKVADRDVKSNRTQTIDLTWKVTGMTPQGDAQVTVTIDRVRVSIVQPPFQNFDYDTSNAKAELPPEPFGSIARQLKAMAQTEYSFTLSPSGSVQNFKIPADSLKRLKEGLPEEGGLREGFTEEAMVEMLKQTSPPSFPDEELKPGKTWSSKPTRIESPLGVLTAEKTYSYQGPDAKNPELILVDTETKVSLEPNNTGDFTAKIRSQQGKGKLAFDLALGRIVSTSMDQTLELSIAAPMNQNIEQTTQTRSVMTLQR